MPEWANRTISFSAGNRRARPGVEGSGVTLSRQPAAPCNLPQTPIVLAFVTVRSRPQRGCTSPSFQSLSSPFHSLSPPKFRLAASRCLPCAGAAAPRAEQQALGAPAGARLGAAPAPRCGRPAGRPGSALQTPRQITDRTLEDKTGFVPLLVAGLTLALGPPPGQVGLPSSPVGLRAAPLAERFPAL